MQLQDFYPIVVTEHLTACRDFYRQWFRFEVTFEATWFVLLAAAPGSRGSLAFMHPSHPSAPPGPEPFSGQGMCLEFQVADARTEYDRFRCRGAASGPADTGRTRDIPGSRVSDRGRPTAEFVPKGPSGWAARRTLGLRSTAGQLRHVLRECLRGELDPFRQREIRVERRGEILDREPEPDR